MMRHSLPLLFLAIIGCAARYNGSPKGCELFTYAGGKHQVEGLIVMPDLMKKQLLELLPQEPGQDLVCWYVSGNGFVLAERRRKNITIYGYKFYQLEDGSWTVEDLPYILSFPKD